VFFFFDPKSQKYEYAVFIIKHDLYSYYHKVLILTGARHWSIHQEKVVCEMKVSSLERIEWA